MRRILSILISLMTVISTPVSAQRPHPGLTESPGALSTDLPVRQKRNNSQKQQVSLDIKDSTVAYALWTLARQANLRLSFDKSNAIYTKRITIRLAETDVMQAFAEVLKGTGLIAIRTSDGETVIVRPSKDIEAKHQANTGTITGRIVDSGTKKGVGGATVAIQGTEISTLTSDQGVYLLKGVPAGKHVLTIKIFGYKSASQQITVKDDTTVRVNVMLAAHSTMLTEVVTTASGTARKLEVGNDIARINVDSIMRVSPVTSVTDLLTARVPGVVVMPSSGVPGAPSRIRLRGTSSIERDSDPIVIVDGVRVNSAQPTTISNDRDRGFVGRPSPIDQIDPNSIESIEVFRGPSASALYGADAGNGVIVIKTKRGQAGRTNWTFNLNAGTTSIPGKWPENFFAFGRSEDGSERQCWNTHNQSAGDWVGSTRCVVIDSVVTFQPLNDPQLTVLGRGSSRGASTTVSGGIQRLTYSLTGSFSDEIGVFRLPGLEAERFQRDHGFRAPSWMRRPSRYTTWGAQSNIGIPLGGSNGMALLTSSLFRSDQQQSSLQASIRGFQNGYISQAFLGTKPIIDEFYYRRQMEDLTFRNAITITGVEVRPWLPLTATIGWDIGNSDMHTVLPRGYYLETEDSIGAYALDHSARQMGTLTIGTTIRRQRARNIPGIEVPIGFQLDRNSGSGFTTNMKDLPSGVTEPSQVTIESGRINRSVSSTYGWFISPRFDVHSRLFVSPGIRLDGGSATGTTAGLSPFPKMDFSWIAIDRPDDPLGGVLTLFRPRVALGVAGVQPAPGDHLRLFRSVSGTSPYTTLTERATLVSIGNTGLRPERSREIEGGFDAELWDQRLMVTMSLYRKLRYDAIVTSPLAPSIGGGAGISFKQNVGDIKNTGFDATIGARIFDNRNVVWHVNALVHKNKNALISLGPGIESRFDCSERVCQPLVPGYPLYAVWTRPIIGISTAQAGVVSEKDIVFGDSLKFVGSVEPNYQLTLSTTLGLLNGRLQFNTAVDYQNGMTQVLGPHIGDTRVFDPTLSQEQQTAFYQPAQQVDVLRWQSLSLSYRAPESVARVFRLSSLAVALQGSNLGLRTSYARGKDPSVNGYGAGGNSVIDDGELPRPRLWRLNITMNR